MDNHVKNKKYGNFVSISSLTGEYAAKTIKKTFAVLVYGHVYIINKITDFFMILAWASLFKQCSGGDAEM